MCRDTVLSELENGGGKWSSTDYNHEMTARGGGEVPVSEAGA
jgi:hypothetical protein